METIWIVDKGEYSDYRVIGVFSTKENAVLVADRFGADVAEWPINPWVDHINQGREPYIVWMERDGTTTRVERWPMRYTNRDEEGLMLEKAPRWGGSAWGRPAKGYCLRGIVYAKDEAHAVKIANETRSRYIAEGKWDEQPDA